MIRSLTAIATAMMPLPALSCVAHVSDASKSFASKSLIPLAIRRSLDRVPMVGLFFWPWGRGGVFIFRWRSAYDLECRYNAVSERLTWSLSDDLDLPGRLASLSPSMPLVACEACL